MPKFKIKRKPKLTYKGLHLIVTTRTDTKLLSSMKIHYSQPKGFVGRNICYSIIYNDIYYGHIIAGSATKHLPGRKEILGESFNLNCIINNIYFHCEKVDDKYPLRNFTTLVLKKFREISIIDWLNKYGDTPICFESLVELPRTGECYRRDGWQKIGQTKGYTCKRVPGKGTDNWTGKRVWDTENLRPKHVFIRKV